MNEFIIVGRALGDIDVKTTDNGLTYAQMLLTVKKPFKNKDGEVDSETLMFTLFKACAEEASSAVKDGTAVIVKGHVNANNYAKDGKITYRADLIADRINVLEDLY